MNIYSPGESEDASDPITITSLNSDASLLINIFCLPYETLPGPISILRHWFVGTTVSPLVLHACFAKRVLESVYIHNSRSPWVLNIKSIVSLRLTWGARYRWTALIVSLLHHAVLTHRLDERAHPVDDNGDDTDKDNDVSALPEEAHEHLIVAGAIQARLVCDDLVSLVIVPVLVVTTWVYQSNTTRLGDGSG